MSLIDDVINPLLKPTHRVLHDINKILLGLNLRSTQLKSLGNVQNRLLSHELLLLGIYYQFGVDQKIEQIKDNLGMPSHIQIVRDAPGHKVVSEATSKNPLHILDNLKGRHQWLGILSKSIAEVNMEQSSIILDEEILQVSVADSQEKGDDWVGGETLHVVIKDLSADSEEPLLLGCFELNLVAIRVALWESS